MTDDIFQLARLGDIAALEAAKKSDVDLNLTNKYGENIIHAALAWNKLEVAKFAISHGVDVNQQSKKGRSPLHVASEIKQLDICILLIDEGANVCALDELGRQPLWYACWLPKGDYRIAELLLSHGANPNHFDINGKSPLSFAQERQIHKLVDILYKN